MLKTVTGEIGIQDVIQLKERLIKLTKNDTKSPDTYQTHYILATNAISELSFSICLRKSDHCLNYLMILHINEDLSEKLVQTANKIFD